MPLDQPVLKINLNKGKNIIAKTSVVISSKVEEIVKNWYPLKPNGNIKLALQVAPNYVKPLYSIYKINQSIRYINSRIVFDIY